MRRRSIKRRYISLTSHIAAAPVSNPASIYVFTSSHYSVAYSSVAGPRPQFADRSAPTDAEKMSAYDTFVANSGTYTVVGDTLVIRPIVSRNPNYMGGGEDKFVMRTSGDTLWLNNVVGAFKFADGQGSANSTNDSYTLIRVR